MGKLGQFVAEHNVAHKLYKQTLLNTVCVVAGISIFFFGYDQGLMGGVNTTRNYAELMGFGHWDEQQQLVVVDKPLLQGGIEEVLTTVEKVAVYYLPGTLAGCLLGGWLGDKYGRITTIGLACLWCVFAAALQSAAQNANWMFCARVLNGIGTGILNAITPVWATETAAHTSRGQFVAFEFTLNIFGVVVAYWLEFGTSKYKDPNSSFIWRFPVAFQIVPLILLFIIIWFMPESPRWLVKVGREDEARFILQRLRGSEGEEGEQAEAELQDIINIRNLEEETSNQQGYLHMLFGIGSGKLHTGRRIGGAATFFVFLYTAIFGATWLTVPWLYPAEIFPLQVRAKGNAWGVVGWSIGNGWCVLLLPTIFDKLNEKTLYIFGGVNVLTIFVVWALYPESNQRTLEEMDLVFASDSIWTWEAEKNFARLKAENPQLVQAAKSGHGVVDPEKGAESRKASLVPGRRASLVPRDDGADGSKGTSNDNDKSSVSHV
ncbi:Sugar transporter STL1 [Metarhizium anisopliae]